MLKVPDVVRAKARLAGADDWLAALPSLTAALAARWGLTLGRAFGDATEAYVVAATRADGRPAVLKLLVPRTPPVAGPEITVLRLAAGRGCAELLAYDEPLGALLLERLGPAMSEESLPFAERLAILTDLAAAVWRVPAGSPALPTGAEKAARLEARLANAAGERRAVGHALAAVRRRARAYDPDRAVVVHGDVHQWNALRAADGGFKLVDPDGLFAEPEFDLGVLMREDPVELMAGDPWSRAEWLAARTGTDPTAIWEWGVVERVTTGLTLAAIGVQPVADQMLAAADAIALTA